MQLTPGKASKNEIFDPKHYSDVSCSPKPSISGLKNNVSFSILHDNDQGLPKSKIIWIADDEYVDFEHIAPPKAVNLKK